MLGQNFGRQFTGFLGGMGQLRPAPIAERNPLALALSPGGGEGDAADLVVNDVTGAFTWALLVHRSSERRMSR